MMKKRLTFIVAMTLAISVIAGGDDRDTAPVESLESLTSEVVAPNSETFVGNQDPKTLKLTIAGKPVSIVAHIACQDKLGLKESNIAIFKRAQTDGSLYNTGPIESFGTEFSPERWDDYFACVVKNGG